MSSTRSLSEEAKQHGHDYDFDEAEDGDDDLDSELFEINLNKEETYYYLDTIIEECESTVFSLDIHNEEEEDDEEDAVYVAVGHDGDHIGSSMGALSWALKHAVNATPSSSTTVYLLHVFPEINLIPSPLGKIPRRHVNREYVNHYLNQKKGKTKLLLQNFTDLCVDSKVKVRIILIEADNVAQAILDFVGKHDIRKLVIGTTKSNLRRKSGNRRRNGIAEKVLKKAHERCDVKMICEGREVTEQLNGSSSSSSSSSQEEEEHEPHAHAHAHAHARAVPPLMRLMTYPMWLFRPRFSSPR